MMEALLDLLTSRDTHWFVQFVKYSLAGGIATMTDILIFYILSWRFIPALREDDIAHRLLRIKIVPVAEERRARNFIVNTAIAFLFSNMVAYILNYLWVFEPGRHDLHIEILLFYAVSLVSVAVGAALGWAMIRYMKLSTTSSYIGRILAALLINFVCRKFIVFRG